MIAVTTATTMAGVTFIEHRYYDSSGFGRPDSVDEAYDDVFPEELKNDLEVVRGIIPWTKKIWKILEILLTW